jgi:hypothetical protein
MRNILTVAFAAGLALVLSGAWSTSLVRAVARSSAPASETISPFEMMKTAPAMPKEVYDLS